MSGGFSLVYAVVLCVMAGATDVPLEQGRINQLSVCLSLSLCLSVCLSVCLSIHIFDKSNLSMYMEANKNLYRSSEMSKVLSSSTPKATRPGNFKRITHHLYLEVLLLFYILLSSCISVVEQTDVISSKS